jgi:aerobic carbon-monoxide dehydrogenase small subunit
VKPPPFEYVAPRSLHEVVELQSPSLTVRLLAGGQSLMPMLKLADFLRHTLLLTGTHLGCEHGVCGACTILVDGSAVRGCLMLAVQADGTQVETVEGLASGAELQLLQQAFMDHHG